MTQSTCLMVSCTFSSIGEWALDGMKTGPEFGSIEWAENELVSLGIVKRKTKLKRLSAKRIAEIIARLHDAESWRDNHECEPHYRDWD